MRQYIFDLRLIESVEDREAMLYTLASECGTPLDILSCRDYHNGVDIFLIEFDDPDEALRAKMIMGFSVVANSNVASVVIPSSTFH